MTKMKVETILFRGTAESANKNMTISYVYDFETDGKYAQ